MTKSKKISYWIATVWLSLGMLSTGIVQLIQMPAEVQKMAILGYPPYLLQLIGAWKILGVLTILWPKMPLLKEWAYAGFFFTMSGALVSHFAVNDPAIEYFGPSLLLLLTCLSWWLRPDEKKIKY